MGCRRKLCLSLLAVATSAFVPVALACSGPASTFFAPPSYIDIDYTSPDFSEASYYYGPKFLMRQVMDGYLENLEPQPNSAEAKLKKAAEGTKEFTLYQRGAEAFYAADYEAALADFKQVADVDPHSLKDKLARWLGRTGEYSWPREAALYMIARTELVSAQTGWDGYPEEESLKVIDQDKLKAAEAAYLKYLEVYPAGLYANSARNIQRFIYMLQGHPEKIEQALKIEIFKDMADDKVMSQSLFDEFLRFHQTPVDVRKDALPLILYAWLRKENLTVQDVDVLEGRRAEFSKMKDVFDYTLALGLYRVQAYQKLLDKLPERPVEKNILSLSSQYLRAMALLKVGKADEAIQALAKMDTASPNEDAINLAIAKIKANAHDTLWLFTNHSPVRNEKILRIMAKTALNDEQLKGALSHPEISGKPHDYLVDEWLLRQMLIRNYAEMNRILLKDAGTKYFASVRGAIATLAKNSKEPTALLNLARFQYKNAITAEFMFHEKEYMVVPAMDELGWCKDCESFEGRVQTYTPPFVLFQEVANAYKHSSAQSETEAEALHRLVVCFKGYEFQMDCRWEQSDWSDDKRENGKDFFVRLHRKYPDSQWAKETPYYY